MPNSFTLGKVPKISAKVASRSYPHAHHMGSNAAGSDSGITNPETCIYSENCRSGAKQSPSYTDTNVRTVEIVSPCVNATTDSPALSTATSA